MMLSIADAAERLGVSQDLVRAEMERGFIPAYRIARTIRIRCEDLDAYIAARRIVPRLEHANDNRTTRRHKEAATRLQKMLGGKS